MKEYLLKFQNPKINKKEGVFYSKKIKSFIVRVKKKGVISTLGKFDTRQLAEDFFDDYKLKEGVLQKL